MTTAHDLKKLCELLPPEVMWGDSITPQIMEEIVIAVFGSEQPAGAHLRCKRCGNDQTIEFIYESTKGE